MAHPPAGVSTGAAPGRSSLRPLIAYLGNRERLGFLVLALLILVVFPLTLGAFRLNMMGKYLTYAFVAVGLVVCWGHGGILSLGQGVFFGLGGYCMAMFLKLEARSEERRVGKEWRSRWWPDVE